MRTSYRFPTIALLSLAAFATAPARPFAAGTRIVFQHPGMLHTRADLDRMRSAVAQGQEPWKSAWAQVKAASVSKLTYTDHAVAVLSVASGGAAGTGQQDDASAAHFHAIQWHVTGDEAHALKAMEILNAWSYKLTAMTGSNARLQSGICGYHFLNAAEILKHVWGKWPAADEARFRKMMLEIFYPVIRVWAPTFNGNWDAYMMATMMSIGIFTDDQAIFEQAVQHFHAGDSKGALRNYVYASGQCQESTRDQMHVQMGLGALSYACETGWNQGLDMYGALDNRLLLGLEYTARYNLGQSVPAEGTISSSGRGTFYPMWEVAYNHYVNRKGLAAPMVQQVIGRIRPERYHQDYVSLGTFLFYREKGATDVRASLSAGAAGNPRVAAGASGLTLTWRAAGKGPVRLALYDARGLEVLALSGEARAAGENSIRWNLPAPAARQSGFFRLEGDGASRIGRITANP